MRFGMAWALAWGLVAAWRWLGERPALDPLAWFAPLLALVGLVPPLASAREAGAGRGRAIAGELFLALIGLIPFLLLYAIHGVRYGPEATGFIHSDMPPYVANGREAFERGNGVMYPSPYATDDAPRPIYFHWYLWLLGLLSGPLGVDPGVAFAATGLIAAWACSWLTLRLVAGRVSPAARAWAFLGAMWGGGVLVLAAGLMNLIQGLPIGVGLFRHDPFAGWWFLNWGRNLVLPTEAVYHALVAGAWLALARGRLGWAVGLTLALGATHPWSGFQHQAVLTAWLGLRSLRREGKSERWSLAAMLAGFGLFLAYYFVYLPLDPAHRKTQEDLTLDWNEPIISLALATGPAALLALVRLVAEAVRWRRAGAWSLTSFDGFLLVAAAVTFGLVKHDWVVRGHQPLHFDRGYLWFPLVLFALPLLREVRRVPGWLGVLVLALASMDNFAWVATTASYQEIGLRLSADARGILDGLDREGATGIILCQDPNLARLAPAYTAMVPYYGDIYFTPDYEQRREAAQRFFAGVPEPEMIAKVDRILCSRAAWERVAPNLAGFRVEAERGGLVLAKREAPVR